MAQAKFGDIVKVHFTCKLEDGTVFDTSIGHDPLTFTIGEGHVIPGLEQTVIGMNQGESKTIEIPADKAFGPHLSEKVHVIAKDQFPDNLQPIVGLKFEIKQEDGTTNVVRVTDVSESSVTLDTNHPLAGKALSFDIELIDIEQTDISKAAELYDQGISFQNKGQLDEAISCYQKAIKLNPNLTGAFYNMGVAFQKKGDIDRAILYYEIAIGLNPDMLEAHHNLGIVFKDKGRFDDAIMCFQRVIQLKPDHADAYYNLAIILKEKGQIDEAMIYLQKAIELNPSFADAYCNLAIIFEESGKLDEALSYYQKALQINPNDAEVHWNMSLTLLSLGNFKQGWREYEWRFEVKDFKQRNFPIPRWDGSSLKGKVLFIYSEQGVGEEIMFASCLPEVIAQAGLCMVECDKRLIPLFAWSFPKARIIARINTSDIEPSQLLQVDMKIAIGSLPLFLRSDLSSFPQQKDYLIADIQKVQIWQDRFRELGPGLKIGISWRGGSKPAEKLARSTVLEQWKNLFSIPGIHFINLQYGDCTHELEEAKEKLGITIHDWEDADPLKDLDNFAAQVSALDLVISVDNATVHMAGALGVPVWALLPYACDWRWMRDFEDTPWYKTVRLIRQSNFGDWDEVFERIASYLRQYISTGVMPEIKCSYKSSISGSGKSIGT